QTDIRGNPRETLRPGSRAHGSRAAARSPAMAAHPSLDAGEHQRDQGSPHLVRRQGDRQIEGWKDGAADTARTRRRGESEARTLTAQPQLGEGRRGDPARRSGYGAGVRPWRRMISAILTWSGGPPAVALITSAASRKYPGPIAAGVIAQSALTSWLPWL